MEKDKPTYEELEIKIKEQEEQLIILKSEKSTENTSVFDALFTENHTIKLIIDPATGKIINANNAACNFYGYTCNELVEMNINQINTLSEEQIKQEIFNAKTGNRNHFNFKHKLKSGEIKDVEVHSGKIELQNKEYLFSIIHDVTKRKQDELEIIKAKEKAEENQRELQTKKIEYEAINEKLKQTIAELYKTKEKIETSERRFRAFVEQAPVAIGLFNLDGTGIYANRKYLEILGLKSVEEYAGRPAYEYFAPQFREESKERTRRRLQGLPVPAEYESIAVRSDGTEFPVQLAIGSIQLAEGTISIAFLNDISKRKQAELLIKEKVEKIEAQNKEYLQLNEELNQTNQKLIKAKEKAEESEQQIRAIFENSQDAIGISQKGISVMINKAYLKMFGYENQNEIIGKSLLEQISPNEHEKIKQYISKRDISQKVPNYYKTLGIRKNGDVFPFETNVGTYIVNNQKYSVGIIRDITERKQVETRLKQAKEKAEENEQIQRLQKEEIELNNERLESLLRVSQYQTNSIQELLDYALNEAIKLTNSKIGYIYFYNETTQQFTLNTWSKDVMKECLVANPQSAYDLDKTGCWGEAVRQRRPIIINDYQAENLLKKGLPEGHVKLLKFLTIPVIFENKVVAVTGVANKITDYNNSDIRQLTLLMDNVWKISERIRLIGNLKAALEKAKESDKLKTSFLNNMSHEVRTPLNAIAGFAQLITKPNQPPEKLKMFSDMISANSNKLIDIITDVIEISEIHANQVNVQISEIEIISFINKIAANFKCKAKEKNLDFQLYMNIRYKEYVIFSDKEKLERILIHLINNAFKFTMKGSVEIKMEICTDAPRGASVQISISDTGIGISDEMQKLVFEPFRQAENGESRNYGGNGLGLALAKAYTELLNGSISLKSEVNKGTTLNISFPVNKPELQVPQKEPIIQNYTINTILIAEDEYSNYLYLCELLNDTHLKILYAANGQEAIDLCRSHSEIGLILMDIKMPIVDGYTAALQIKEFRPYLPIIAQSAYALKHEREKYSGIAFDDYITKPINENELKQKLMKYIDKY